MGITGLGGVFFKCNDPEKLREWYAEKLGLATEQYGRTFSWNDPKGSSVWAPFPKNTTYFSPSDKEFMINFRVNDLPSFLEEIRAKDVEIIGELTEVSYGKFAHILDLEGNKIELWEPVDPPITD
ncbi:VOC family protein [Sporosarcina ureilytica]|uniref:Glyoxalase n=1 Tax=Sporosarcina ureilytica TaxID=298596 RepID=A0A1D8JHI2_9BACL|nr:VOC family protein [Sporosarcina ureilytica]AOV08171.1 glyoxalase [Sporosarcina ureilytica]